jgi:hypothetical protein
MITPNFAPTTLGRCPPQEAFVPETNVSASVVLEHVVYWTGHLDAGNVMSQDIPDRSASGYL